MVRAVVFDLDGVLRRRDPAVMAGAESACGLAPGEIARAAFEDGLLSAAVTGRITDGQWREQVSAALAGQV